jgi:hypothetical protein
MSDFPTYFRPKNDIAVSITQCPRYFAQFLFGLMDEIEDSWKKDQEKDNLELMNFLERRITLNVSNIFGHLERLLTGIQAGQIVGPNALQENEDYFATQNHSNPDLVSWDPAAYSVYLSETEHGYLLFEQELPIMTHHFLVEILSDLNLTLIRLDDNSENAELWDFKENHIGLHPEFLTCQFGRLFEMYLEK